MYSFNNNDNDENVIAITQPLELIYKFLVV